MMWLLFWLDLSPKYDVKVWNNITMIRTVTFWLHYLNFAKNYIHLVSKNLFQTSLLIMLHSKQRLHLAERKTWSEYIWLANLSCQSLSKKIAYQKHKNRRCFLNNEESQRREQTRAGKRKQTKHSWIKASRGELRLRTTSCWSEQYRTFINH